MAWQDTMIVMLRWMVNDVAATTYTDASLEEALTVGARFVLGDITFVNDYDVDPVNVSISPDPTTTATRDDDFINLVCARTAAMFDQGAAIKAAGQAILVQDGTSRIDLRESYKAAAALLGRGGWMAKYEEMRDDYLLTRSTGSVGKAIMTPIRNYATGGYLPFMTKKDYRP